MAWLEEFVKEYAYPSEEILAAADKQGFTFDNVKDAKAPLKAKGFHASNRGRFGGVWWFGKGFPDTWRMRPDPSVPHPPHYPHNGQTAVKNNGSSPIVGIVGSADDDLGEPPFDDLLDQEKWTPR